MLLSRLVAKNAFRHKLRTALTVVGIVVAITAFGLLRTIVDAWYAGANASSSARLVTRSAVSLVFSLPLTYAQKIHQVEGVKGVSLPPKDETGVTESVYHMFVIRLDSLDARESLARALKEQGIETGVHYPVPNHRQPAITALYGETPTLPKTEDYVRRILSLPMFPAITEEQVRTVAAAVKNHLRRK